MEFKYMSIDPKTATKTELKKEIDRLDQMRARYEGEEQAVKIFINSIYGASASPYFAGYNIRVAEAITMQGQEMDKFAIKIMNRYFMEFWHKDKEAHEAMGIKGLVQKVTREVVVYGDTDSVAADSTISTNNGDFTIEQLYEMGKEDKGSTLAGHESVSCDMLIKNWSKEKGVYFAKPERIIRHKVYKKKYKLKTKSGKEVYVTGDHSLILFRNGEQIVGTVKDIKPGDKVLTVWQLDANEESEIKKNLKEIENGDYRFEDVEVEECGYFDEYVYDIEIADETHSFIANDILVHNSIYVSFEDAIKSCNWDGDGTSFILALYKIRLENYITKCFEKYAKDYNTNNIQTLELEKIAESAIILAKKKYALDLVWKDPGVNFEPQSKIDTKGVEIVQSSTPVFVRENLKRLLNILFKEKNKLNIKDFVEELRIIKDKFKLCELEDISFSRSISDYEKYILDDREKLKIAPKCPIHVRAAGIYNYKVNTSKWKNKYQLIKSSDKIRYYHAKSSTDVENVFAYQPGNYPYEFAPDVNYDMQFSKTIIEPINRFVIAMGFGAIPENLITSKRLF